MGHDHSRELEHVRKKLAELKSLPETRRDQALIDFWQSRLDFLLQAERRN